MEPSLLSRASSGHTLCCPPSTSATRSSKALPPRTALDRDRGRSRRPLTRRHPSRAAPPCAIPPASSAPGRSTVPNPTLYGSRTAFGQQLLRIVLEAPDVDAPAAHDAGATPGSRSAALSAAATAATTPSGPPSVAAANAPACDNQQTLPPEDADAAASTAGEAPASLGCVASLVREVAALMVSHRDMVALLQAMDSCQARVNAVRAGGCWGGNSGGGWGGSGGGWGGSGARTSTGGGFASGRSSFGGLPEGGAGAASTATAATAASAFASTAATPQVSAGSASSQGPASAPAPAPPTSPPPLAAASGPAIATRGSPAASESLPLTLQAATSGPEAAGAAAEPAAAGAKARDWDWRLVRRVVVVGLGSLAAYRGALSSGRQTERESTRAASRLYQLSLSTVLASPAALPGLRNPTSGRGSAPSPSATQGASEPWLSPLALAADAVADAVGEGSGGAAAAAQGGGSAEGAGLPAAAAAATAVLPPPPQVLYFDPEYLPWDVRLVQSLWSDSYRAFGADACGHAGLGGEKGGTAEGGRESQRQGWGAGAAAAAAAAAAATGVAASASATAAPRDALVADEPTLFYAPCCPRELYDEVVRHNMAAGTLRNVALVGNSLKAQADTALLLRALGGGGGGGLAAIAGFGRPSVAGGGSGRGAAAGFSRFGSAAASGGGGGGGGTAARGEGEEAFVELVAEGRVAEVMLPDFAAHGVATALHLFA